MSSCIGARGHGRACAGGVSLLEVLVAILVAGVGLLGMAKLQAVGLSGGKNARVRAMVALQAESLAASITALPGYWSRAPRSFRLSGAQVFDASAPLAALSPPDCAVVDCNAAAMASFDLARWAGEMNARVPGYSARVGCGQVVTGQCTLTVQWTESSVLSRAVAAAPAAAAQAQSFTLHLLP